MQTSDNIFVPPSSPAPPPQLPSNRNYYNASIYNHGVGYQTQQQAQIQQQPAPFQQPQKQQPPQEATALPSPFDSSYYSVYDDDVDLYRDIEYQQQQEQQQQQQQLQQQQQQEYQSNIRQQQQHTTYRPLEILTTPQPVHRPTYNAQPVLSYSTDYDEDPNAQVCTLTLKLILMRELKINLKNNYFNRSNMIMCTNSPPRLRGKYCSSDTS